MGDLGELLLQSVAAYLPFVPFCLELGDFSLLHLYLLGLVALGVSLLHLFDFQQSFLLPILILNCLALVLEVDALFFDLAL